MTFAAGIDNSASITLTDAQTTTLTATQGLITGSSAAFTVSPANATTLTATSGANQSATVNTAFTNKLVATATDAYGNGVSGVAVTFAAPSSGASATFAACSSNPQSYSCTQTTGANGQATSSTFTANGTNGAYTITASATGLTSVTYAEANKGNQTITFTTTAPANAAVGGATYTPAATATSGLAVTITVDASSAGVCSINGGGVVSFTGPGTCTLDANQAGNANWNAAPQVQQSFTVKRNQTITFTTAAPGARRRSVVPPTRRRPPPPLAWRWPSPSTPASSAVCSITGGVVSFQAAGTCTLDANQAGNGTYYAAPQVQQSFTVGKGSQTITFTSTAPASATVGGATYTAAATATSGLTVTFTSGSAGVCTSGGTNGSVFTFVGAGTCIVDANQAGNANWNAAPQVQQTFAVKSNQTISFTSTNPSPVTVGGATYTPTATATSGLAVTITLDGTSTGCTLSGGVVSFTAVGTCKVDANQAGNGTWNAAPQVQQSITVNKGNQTISFTSTNPSPVTVGGATYTPTATATSGLAVTITLDGTSTGCTLSGGVVSFTAVGTCLVDANQAGNANCNAAPQVQQSITVNKGNQTISFTSTNPSPVTVGGATYTPTATATSGLAVTITLDGTSTGCTLSGGVVSFTAVGTCKIDANQAGNANYNAAPQVQQSITVNKGNQTISFTSTAPGSAAVGGATYTAAATATSGLTVTFTSGSTGVCTSGGTNGSVFTFVGAGTCIVDANQTGNANWNAAPQVQQTFTVKNNQTISFTSTAPANASVAGATYTAAATATSGLTVTFTSGSTGVCTSGGSNGSVFTFVGAGTCIVDANQAGNGTYYAAPQVQQSFSVAGLTITSDQYSSTGNNGPRLTFSGIGATGNTVTVTVCTANSFPCSGGNTVSTVTTGGAPTNPWTTGVTSRNAAIVYGTTYYAQATQTGQTSPVFTFTPAQPAPTAVALANGGTLKKADTGDTATITFSAQLDATTICAAWSNSGIQTVANATITFTSGTPDSFTATSPTCTGGGNFGTVYTGSTNYVTGTVTFTGSTIAWNPNNDTLTFTLGTTLGTVGTNVTAGAPGYTLNANVTDIFGFPASVTRFTSGSASGF